MAGFVPYYGKKRTRLAARECESLEVLRGNATESRIDEAVDTIRTAHVRALMEKRQKFAPSEKNVSLYEEIERAIRWWTESPKATIIEGYQDAKRQRKMSSPVRRATK